MKSVLENIYLSKDLSYQIPWSKSASLHPELPQGVLKVTAAHRVQSLQRRMANVLVAV